MNTLAMLVLLGLLPVITFGDKPYFTELETLKPSQTAAIEKVIIYCFKFKILVHKIYKHKFNI